MRAVLAFEDVRRVLCSVWRVLNWVLSAVRWRWVSARSDRRRVRRSASADGVVVVVVDIDAGVDEGRSASLVSVVFVSSLVWSGLKCVVLGLIRTGVYEGCLTGFTAVTRGEGGRVLGNPG